MAGGYGNAILAVLKVLGGPLLFGIIIGSTGPSIDTMKNAVLDYKGNILMLDDTNSLVVFSPNEASIFSAIVAVGAMAGALLGGSIVGFSGFKFGMMLTIPFYLIAWGIMWFGSNVWLLYSARALTGLAVGINSFAVPTYISDVSPNSLRGILGACNQLSITIGILLVYLIGILFREDGGFSFSTGSETIQVGVAPPGSFCNWRKMALVNIVPTVLWMIALVFLPESPRWLASCGNAKKAKGVLRYLRGGESLPSEEDELDALQERAMKRFQVEASPNAPTVSRKRKASYSKQVFCGIMLQVFQQFSGINAVMFFCTTILRNAHIEHADAVSVTVMIEQVVMTFIACLLVDRVGRKPLLITSASIMAVACGCFGTYFLVDNKSLFLVYFSIYTYIGAFSLGVGPIPWLMMGEMFPNEIRTSASAAATVVNWTCAFLVTLCMDKMIDWIKYYGVMFFFGVCCVLMVVFVTILIPETKGKSFADIQAAFGGIPDKYERLEDEENAFPENDNNPRVSRSTMSKYDISMNRFRKAYLSVFGEAYDPKSEQGKQAYGEWIKYGFFQGPRVRTRRSTHNFDAEFYRRHKTTPEEFRRYFLEDFGTPFDSLSDEFKNIFYAWFENEELEIPAARRKRSVVTPEEEEDFYRRQVVTKDEFCEFFSQCFGVSWDSLSDNRKRDFIKYFLANDPRQNMIITRARRDVEDNFRQGVSEKDFQAFFYEVFGTKFEDLPQEAKTAYKEFFDATTKERDATSRRKREVIPATTDGTDDQIAEFYARHNTTEAEFAQFFESVFEVSFSAVTRESKLALFKYMEDPETHVVLPVGQPCAMRVKRGVVPANTKRKVPKIYPKWFRDELEEMLHMPFKKIQPEVKVEYWDILEKGHYAPAKSRPKRALVESEPEESELDLEEYPAYPESFNKFLEEVTGRSADEIPDSTKRILWAFRNFGTKYATPGDEESDQEGEPSVGTKSARVKSAQVVTRKRRDMGEEREDNPIEYIEGTQVGERIKGPTRVNIHGAVSATIKSSEDVAAVPKRCDQDALLNVINHDELRRSWKQLLEQQRLCVNSADEPARADLAQERPALSMRGAWNPFLVRKNFKKSIRVP